MRHTNHPDKNCQSVIVPEGIGAAAELVRPHFDTMIRTVPAHKWHADGHWAEGPELVLPGTLRSYDRFLAACSRPWEKGIELVRRMVADLKKRKLPEPECIRRRPVFRPDRGDEVDNDRLRSGMDFWRSTHRPTVRGPRVVTVMADASTSAAVPADQILWRGAAALALTDVLEKAGYRVDLWVYKNCKQLYLNGSNGFLAVRLKGPDKPFNLAALAAGASGWFYRYAFFAMAWLAAGVVPEPCMGIPRHALDEWQMRLVTPDTPIVVHDVWNYHAALDRVGKWVTEVIEGKLVHGLKDALKGRDVVAVMVDAIYGR